MSKWLRNILPRLGLDVLSIPRMRPKVGLSTLLLSMVLAAWGLSSGYWAINDRGDRFGLAEVRMVPSASSR